MPLAIPGLRHDVPLAPYTTLGLGGPAAHFLEATSHAQLREALAAGLRLLVLGGGSNLVVPDAGFDGLVIRVGLRGVRFADDSPATLVSAEAGEPWDDLVADSCRRGLGGLECLSGIPGLTGGTPIQNVGAYGQEVAETIAEVTTIDRRTLETRRFAPGECGFGYRTSRFKHADADRFVVTGVTFRLEAQGRPAPRYAELQAALADRQLAPGREAMEAVRDTVLALRRRKGMVLDPGDPDTRSAGSFFTNPVLDAEALTELERRWRARGGDGAIPRFAAAGGTKVPAAWLVEQAGFPRGLARDGVGISSKHALALVNRGGTTAALLTLVGAIQQEVHERFGVSLVPEPVIVA